MRKTVIAGAALVAVGIAGFGFARPAAAQTNRYYLSGVTFDDGTSATGFFDYDPGTNLIGDYDITTTDGQGALFGGGGSTAAIVGFEYTPADSLTQVLGGTGMGYFQGLFETSTIQPMHLLALNVDSELTFPSPLPLDTTGGTTFELYHPPTSNEIVRQVVSGALVTAPEPSSLGLLSVLGAALALPAGLVRRRRRSEPDDRRVKSAV